MSGIERAEQIRQEIQEIRASLPAHSVQPAQLMRLEELEEQLAELLENSREEGDAAA
jgi:hypothetical protein